MRARIGLLLVSLCLMLGGCASRTVWRSESISPDGKWIAVSYASEGTSLISGVELVRRGAVGKMGKPFTIFLFDSEIPAQHPEGAGILGSMSNLVQWNFAAAPLDEDSAKQHLGLSTRWETSSKLAVMFRGRGNCVLTVSEFDGISVVFSDLTSPPNVRDPAP